MLVLVDKHHLSTGDDPLEHRLGEQGEPCLRSKDLFLELVDALLEVPETHGVGAGVDALVPRGARGRLADAGRRGGIRRGGVPALGRRGGGIRRGVLGPVLGLGHGEAEAAGRERGEREADGQRGARSKVAAHVLLSPSAVGPYGSHQPIWSLA